MHSFCIVCGNRLRLDTRKCLAHGVGSVSEISGRSIREIVVSIFPRDEELLLLLRGAEPDPPDFPSDPGKGPAICQTCHDLTEQIDAFQTQLDRSRESIVLRREKLAAAASSGKNPTTRKAKTANPEALQQLPASTKVETMKVEPEFGNDDDDMSFPELPEPEEFLLDVPVPIKKEDGEDDESKAKKLRSRLGSSHFEVADLLMVRGPDGAAEDLQEMGGSLQQTVKDFESDADYLKTEMPGEIKSQEAAEAWDSFLLRSETDLSSCGIPGETRCFLCPRGDFDTIEERISHVVEEHCVVPGRPFSCDNCAGVFAGEREAFDHVRSEHGEKIVGETGVAIPREPLVDSGDPRLFCHRCSVVSSSRLGYWLHYWRRHKKYEGSKCPVCEREHGTVAELRRHFLVAHLEYRYKEKEKEKEKPKRSREMTPLTVCERAVAVPDQYLAEPSGGAEQQRLSGSLKEEMEEQVRMLRAMPDAIRTAEEAARWDVSLLKMEATKMAYGIPGENRCAECDASTRNPGDRLSHMVSAHGHGESYRCGRCSKSWSSEEAAFHHVKTKHLDAWQQDRGERREPVEEVEGQLQCRYCTLVATSELAFWLHTAGRHKRFKKVRCSLCSRVCCNGPQYRRHVLSYHGHYRYECPATGCAFSNRSIDAFKAHVKEEHGEKADRQQQPQPPPSKKSRKAPVEFMTCDLCGRESRGEKFHAKHMFTQHGIAMKMSCGDCGKECRSVRDLEVHRRQEHCVASCHLCGKPFFTAGHLSSHLRNVHDVGGKADEFICEICAKTFPAKSYLRVHMRTHKDKHIKCQLCPKMFRWESGLYSHMAAAHSHSGQTYTCEFCGKQFKDKSNLKSHRYTHLDVKPHSCSKCGRGFIRRDMMLTHEKSCRL